MSRRKKIGNFLIISFTTLTLLVVVFEFTYRFQVFDYYKAELCGLNTQQEINSTNPKILVCGDSFSASPESYVKAIKDSFPQYAVINAAVPGTGIIQHALYIPKRIKRFKPAVFIYQFYVGNDLFDISHPISSPKLSFSRKVYWWITDRLLSLSFLNFRFAGVRYKYYDDAKVKDMPKIKDVFSPMNYSNREKLNYNAEPALLENTLYLLNGRDKDLQYFESKFREMIKGLNKEAKKIFVIVPHQAQVSGFYFNNHQLLGAPFKNELYRIPSENFPIYARLKKLCGELGFVFIDPLEEFRQIDTSRQLYYSNDPHLNLDGGRFLGLLLNEKLKQILKD